MAFLFLRPLPKPQRNKDPVNTEDRQIEYYIPHIKAMSLVVSDKKIFSCFPYNSQYKSCDFCGGGIFGPSGII